MTRIAELQDRLRRLAKRREDEGIYTDANLVEAASSRIAELEAEVALLRRTNVELQQFINERANERDEWKARAEALSRTGAVKVGPLAHVIAEMLERAGEPRPNGDILHDILVQVLPAALEPVAPEGQQEPVAWRAIGEDNVSDLTERRDIADQWERDGIPVTPLFTRPSEQAVTEAALRDAARRIVPYLRWAISNESPGHHPTMPSAVGAFMTAFGWDTEEKWREDQRSFLKAAMEAGRHD